MSKTASQKMAACSRALSVPKRNRPTPAGRPSIRCSRCDHTKTAVALRRHHWPPNVPWLLPTVPQQPHVTNAGHVPGMWPWSNGQVRSVCHRWPGNFPVLEANRHGMAIWMLLHLFWGRNFIFRKNKLISIFFNENLKFLCCAFVFVFFFVFWLRIGNVPVVHTGSFHIVYDDSVHHHRHHHQQQWANGHHREWKTRIWRKIHCGRNFFSNFFLFKNSKVKYFFSFEKKRWL